MSWDFTHDEKDVWEKSLQAANELKKEFEAEGNLEIYQDWVGEVTAWLEYCVAGRRSRYLYLVRL